MFEKLDFLDYTSKTSEDQPLLVAWSLICLLLLKITSDFWLPLRYNHGGRGSNIVVPTINSNLGLRINYCYHSKETMDLSIN
jgi:hypothetical protein